MLNGRVICKHQVSVHVERHVVCDLGGIRSGGGFITVGTICSIHNGWTAQIDGQLTSPHSL